MFQWGVMFLIVGILAEGVALAGISSTLATIAWVMAGLSVVVAGVCLVLDHRQPTHL